CRVAELLLHDASLPWRLRPADLAAHRRTPASNRWPDPDARRLPCQLRGACGGRGHQEGGGRQGSHAARRTCTDAAPARLKAPGSASSCSRSDARCTLSWAADTPRDPLHLILQPCDGAVGFATWVPGHGEGEGWQVEGERIGTEVIGGGEGH